MRHLDIGTWALIGEGCPMSCRVEGSDYASVVIGDDDQSMELLRKATAGLASSRSEEPSV